MMRAIRRILVAIKEPKSRSLRVLAKAAQLAKATGAEIELFHGIATPVLADAFSYTRRGLPEFERGTRERYVAALEQLAERLRKTGTQVSVSSDWDFPVSEAIVRRALRINADLIIAEPHAGRRLAPWLLHLTDWELLRLSPVPVLLVKNARPYRNPVVLAAIDPSHAFAKTAKLDREILQAGGLVSKALHGTLHVMHAYAPVPLMVLTPETASAYLTASMEAEALARARTAFDRALGTLKLAPARRHLIGRHPTDAIQDVARETHSAIVVMGAVSRSGMKRLFIGNTAERVLDDLPCDVLVVKPPGFVSRVARASRGVRFVASALPTSF
jgi:universal stress protein E